MADFLLWMGSAIGVFAGTNVDDIVILTLLFLASRASGRPKVWQIWAGQYLGIAALVAVSGLAALGLTSVPDPWVGAFGVVPIAIGIRSLVKSLRQRGMSGGPGEARSPAAADGVLAIGALIIIESGVVVRLLAAR